MRKGRRDGTGPRPSCPRKDGSGSGKPYMPGPRRDGSGSGRGRNRRPNRILGK